ncbi:MAG: hypothetical protein U0900_12060 [Myxococcota bacterium]
MSKLWIVHRKPPVRAALARASGVASGEIAAGGPTLADFSDAGTPDAIVLGLPPEADLALERAFVDAARARTAGARWIVLCEASDARAVTRLFGAGDTAILPLPPDRAALRTEIAAAFASRRVAPIDAPRRDDRAAAHFEAWLGDTPIPGLALALDASLGALPLLVRGRAGSGRAVRIQHRDATRGGAGARLRLDAREAGLVDRLAARLAAREAQASASTAKGAGLTIWLDEVDALTPADQRALADWITHALAPDPASPVPAPLRWLATAGPAGLDERLEPALARAFVPLTLEVPPLAREADEIERIAERIARLWAEATGGPVRRFDADAIAALAEEPWWGERAELEAVVRATLAGATTTVVGRADLRFPDAPEPLPTRSPRSAVSAAPEHGLEALPIDREGDPSSELLALTEAWSGAAPATSSRPDEATGSAADATTRPAPGPGGSAAAVDPNPAWRRLARSLAPEIRNPLVSIRTFTELLPDHYADETFRIRFKELVGKDVAHIQDVVARLAKAAERERLETVPVDVSGLIERLLAARRDRIAGRRLVVLSELERDAPQALADADALETALAGLIDRALDSLPDRGDLFVTTRRIPRAGDGRPRLRVLLRHHNPLASGLSGELDPVNHILEYVLAETIVSALGGRLTIDPTLGPETLIVIDLPTPPSAADA